MSIDRGSAATSAITDYARLGGKEKQFPSCYFTVFIPICPLRIFTVRISSMTAPNASGCDTNECDADLSTHPLFHSP